MKTALKVLVVLAMQILGGCSNDNKPPVIWDWNGPAAIEFRGSVDWDSGPLTAPADSSVEIGIGVIVLDVQGVALPDAEVTLSTIPTAVSIEPDTGRGATWFRLLLHVPPDTTYCVLTAKCGSVQNRLTLTLIGE